MKEGQFEIQNTDPKEVDGEKPWEGHSYLCVFDIRPNGVGASHNEHHEKFKPSGRLKTKEADAIAKIEAEAFMKNYAKDHPSETCSLVHLYRCVSGEPLIHIYPQY